MVINLESESALGRPSMKMIIGVRGKVSCWGEGGKGVWSGVEACHLGGVYL